MTIYFFPAAHPERPLAGFCFFGQPFAMPAFSPEQDAALKAVAAWLKAKPGRGNTPLVFRLFG